jgi:hypothetical protein
MKRKTGLLIILLVGVLILPGWQNLQAESSQSDPGISFTWQDLQKVLGLGDSKIKMSWQEFRQLLKQTGTKIYMDFQLKDGVVTLTRQQFAQILKRMKSVIQEIPRSPVPYLVTRATYSGMGNQKTSHFQVRLIIYVFDQQKPTYISVPILNARVAISDLKVNNRPAVVRTKGGWYQVSLQGKGYHTVTASFSLTNNRNYLSFPVVKATTNRIEFLVPEKDMLISSPGSHQNQIENRGNKTIFTAMAPPVSQVHITWGKRRRKTKKKPALFYANSTTLISVAAEVVKAHTRVQLEILQSSLEQVSILLPEHYDAIRVEVGRKNNWLTRETAIGRVLEIHFGYEVNRRCQFSLYLERSITAETLGVDFTGIKILDARRESGNIGVVADSTVEVAVADIADLEKLEYHQVPKSILKMSALPILNCFKYSKHPYQLDLTIQKHERLQGIATVIESARATLLYLQEGKLLHQITYRVRNSYKQFIELELPREARIWSVLVDKKPEKASKKQNGKILLPLIRSGGKGDRLKSFLVELVYSMPARKFAIKGSAICSLPKSDIFVNKMDLEIFLPHGYSYSFDRGEWANKKTAIPKGGGKPPAEFLAPKKTESQKVEKLDNKPITEAGEKVSHVMKKLKGKPGIGLDKESEIKEERIKKTKQPRRTPKGIKDSIPKARSALSQSLSESRKRIGGKYMVDGLDVYGMIGPAGLRSVKVHLPLTGLRFAFVKKIIDKNESFPMTISFMRTRIKTIMIIGITVLLLVIGLILVFRRMRRG